jgi:hypothetical protein
MQLPTPPIPRRVHVLVAAVVITGWILGAGLLILMAIFHPEHTCVSIFGSHCPHDNAASTARAGR